MFCVLERLCFQSDVWHNKHTDKQVQFKVRGRYNANEQKHNKDNDYDGNGSSNNYLKNYTWTQCNTLTTIQSSTVK